MSVTYPKAGQSAEAPADRLPAQAAVRPAAGDDADAAAAGRRSLICCTAQTS